MGAADRPRRLLAGLVLAVAAALVACGTESPRSPDDGPSGTGRTVPDTTRPADTTIPAPVGPLSVGATADLEGPAVTVVRADVGDQTNRGLARGRFLLVTVRLEAGEEPVAFGPRDWSLDTADGLLRPFALAEDDRLGFGQLPAGAVEEGRVAFDLGGTGGPARLRYASAVGEAAWSVDLGGGVPPSGEVPPVSSAP